MKPGHLAIAALVLCAASARAQDSRRPNLVFSIGLGLTTGQELWHVPQAPIPVIGGGEFDTMALGRQLVPGLTGTLGITYFSSQHLGYTLEIGYFGVNSDQACTGPAQYKPQDEAVNEQACVRAQGVTVATAGVGFQAGLTYRVAPAAGLSPYLRIGAGPALMGTPSFVRTSGTVLSSNCGTADNLCVFNLIDEQKPAQVSWMATLAGGVALYLGPAYRIRVEARDLITSLSYPTGPADFTSSAGGYAPVATKVVHVPTVTVGLDVVLERQHSRRY